MQDKAIWIVRYNFAEQMRQLYRRLYVTLDVPVLRWFLKKEFAYLWDKWRRWRRCRDALEAYLEKWNASLEEVSTESLVGSATDFKTVKIGDVEWMAENLAIDDGGDGIFKNEENGEYYYTWDAAMRIAKAIPGWHLPSTAEWNAAAEACGAAVVDNGFANNTDCRDYDAIDTLKEKLGIQLVGCYDGHFGGVGVFTHFWSSTRCNAYSYSRFFYMVCRILHASTNDNSRGLPVRFVKDSGKSIGEVMEIEGMGWNSRRATARSFND